MDKESFKLGKQVGEIKAWCEAAGNGAKAMSLSAPFRPQDYEVLLPWMEKLASRNKVQFHLERTLLVTDLFPDINLTNIWVFIIYREDRTLEEYASLKVEKERLVQEERYLGEAQRGIATRMGLLLGYDEGLLKRRLE